MYREAGLCSLQQLHRVWVWHQTHVQPTWSFCSFRARRILATAALSWSLWSSWFMMPNRLLQEISLERNYMEAASCCWHAHVLSWTTPSLASYNQSTHRVVFAQIPPALYFIQYIISWYDYRPSSRKRLTIWVIRGAIVCAMLWFPGQFLWRLISRRGTTSYHDIMIKKIRNQPLSFNGSASESNVVLFNPEFWITFFIKLPFSEVIRTKSICFCGLYLFLPI